jgi:hypothetical protein
VRRLLLLALLGVSCAPSTQELLQAGTWSHAARVACQSPGACPKERACIAAVAAATLTESGRREYKAAQLSCAPYGARP